MKEVHCLENWDQVQAIANPIRLRALELLGANPASPLELAKTMQVKQTTLYHHLDALVQAGLIVVVAERQARGCVERTYQAIARKFVLDQQVLRSPQTNSDMASLLIGAIESALIQAKECAESGALESSPADRMRALRIPLRATPEVTLHLGNLIQQILDVCEASQSTDAPDSMLTLVMHPTSLTQENQAT